MNCIKIELCAEDRARLDQIIELLGGLRRPDCSSCVEGVASYMAKAADVMDAAVKAPTAVAAPDEVDLALSKVLADHKLEAPQSAPVAEPVKPSVTLEQIQKKATQIAAGSADKKAKLRAIVNKYAAKVTDLPESVWLDVWDALCALETEA